MNDMTQNEQWYGLTEREAELYNYYFHKSIKGLNVFFSVWAGCGIFGMIASVISQIGFIISGTEDMFISIFTLIAGLVVMYFVMVKFPLWIKRAGITRELTGLRNGSVRICRTKASGKEIKLRQSGGNGHRAKYNRYIRVFYPDISGVGGIYHNILASPGQYDNIALGDDVIVICYDDSMKPDYMFAVKSDWFEQIEAMQSKER